MFEPYSMRVTTLWRTANWPWRGRQGLPSVEGDPVPRCSHRQSRARPRTHSLTLRAGYGVACDTDTILRGLAQDKKGAVGSPEFVLVRRAGDLVLGVTVPEPVLRELCQSAP